MPTMRTPKTVVNPGWKEIEPLGWGTWSNDFHIVGRLMWKLYTPDTILALRQFVAAQVTKLYGAVDVYEKQYYRRLNIGSDDGKNDVMHHVVGMGEAEFNRVIQNIILLEDRYNADYDTPEGYRESFSYCFLTDRD